jgi:CheY-like chemotaxis protein
MSQGKKLLLVIEVGGYGNLQPLLEELGFEVAIETSARRAMSRLKTWNPDVLVADFYRRYFHDRVSNLESLLAIAARDAHTRIIVLYDPFHAADVELLRQRHRIDAALTLPLSTVALQEALSTST